MYTGQVGWGGEEVGKVDALRTRPPSSAYSVLRSLGFILNVLGCPVVFMRLWNSMFLLRGDAAESP